MVNHRNVLWSGNTILLQDMDIAIISSANGGVGNFTFNMVRELGTLVESIDLYIYSDPSRYVPRENLGENVTIKVEENSPQKFLANMIVSTKDVINHDIIHNIILSPYIYLLQKFRPYSNFASVNTVHRHNDTEPVEEITSYDFESVINNLYQRIELAFQPRVSKHADATVTVSKDARDVVERLWDIYPEVIYHGVDQEEFSHDEYLRSKYRKNLNLSDGEFLFLFVGVLYPRKDIGTLIKAIPHILEKNPNAHFVIVGRGEQLNMMNDMISKKGIQDHVTVENYIEDISMCYSAADIFVNPSISEGFGIVYIEAMQSGCPVIAADISVANEVIDDAGLFFEPGNHQDLSEKALTLINDNALYEDVRRSALERAELFTWEKAARDYKEVYDKAFMSN